MSMPPNRRGSRPVNRSASVSGPRLVAGVERYIWGDEHHRPGWQSAAIHAMRMIWAVGRDVAGGQLTLQAMSLVYTTLLSLVPLLAISFSILKGFGVHNQIEPFLLNLLEPLGERREEVVGRIVGFVDNVQVGVLGSVGFILLFYTVVSLMQKIEHAFNDVWQISARRTFTERFKDYLSVIIVGPVLVFASLGISATVMSDPLMERLVSIQPVGLLVELLGRLVPVVMVSLAFTFIYMFVPHTRVRLVAALTGGAVAGLLWNALGWMFAAFVSQASRYTAIYSGFATPILFMIWLYVGWLIMLIGATIAFYRQHPEYLSGRQVTSNLSSADRERLALHAVTLIGERFYSGEPPPDVESLASRLLVPVSAIEQVLDALEHAGLLACTAAVPPRYVPGCPWETASVNDVLETTHRAHRGSDGKRPPVVPHRGVDAMLDKRREVVRQTFGDVSLKSLATGHAATVPGSAPAGRDVAEVR